MCQPSPVLRPSPLLLAFAALLIAAAAPPGQAEWYRIDGPRGQQVGWQHEPAESASGMPERVLAYQVAGHEPIRQRLSGAALLRDPDVPPLKAIAGLIAGQAPLGNDLTAYSVDQQRSLVVRRSAGRFVAAWWVSRDEAGRIQQVVQPLLGSDLTYTPVSGPALSQSAIGLPSLPHPMLASPYNIPPSARRGHMRYGLNLPAPLEGDVPATSEQAVTHGPDGLVLDICTHCNLPGAARPADPGEWLRPSRWIESDAPELRRAVAGIASPRLSGDALMRGLSRVARTRLSGIDYEGHYSARAAWHRRKGDCTENAVLLAALARAAGIPARVASGLVYDRERYHGTSEAFLPHAWTLAWIDGRWRSYDISVEGFDATHVALTIGDGDPESITAAWRLAAFMQWQSLAEVRSSPVPRVAPPR